MINFTLETALLPTEWYKRKQSDECRNWPHVLLSRYSSKESEVIFDFCNGHYQEGDILFGVGKIHPHSQETHFAIAFKNIEDWNLFKLCIPQKIK